MIITLLHPSRGRAQLAFETYNQWMSLRGGIQIEHILSIDHDDHQRTQYLQLFPNSKILVANNSCVVEATNKAAKLAEGDILVYFSDDFKCPHNWDGYIQSFLAGRENQPSLLKVDDCLQPFDAEVLTIPIMNKALYQRLGYFWHPDYRSMFVDVDLYYVCKNNGWMVEARDLKFPHHHHTNGKMPDDETYKKSSANWGQGEAVLNQRKSQGFPV